MPTLTDRQADMYNYIRKHIAKHQYPPTIREIAAEFGIGSPNGVVCTLDALEHKGMLIREAKMSRGIRLVGGIHRCPVCGGAMKGGRDD